MELTDPVLIEATIKELEAGEGFRHENGYLCALPRVDGIGALPVVVHEMLRALLDKIQGEQPCA